MDARTRRAAKDTQKRDKRMVRRPTAKKSGMDKPGRRPESNSAGGRKRA